MKLVYRTGVIALLLMGTGAFGQQVVSRQPAPGAEGVCVDTHLTLTFDQSPVVGKAGTIRIYDAADDTLVDTVDVGVPTNQQTYVFGGSPLHAFPVIASEKSATIYPHTSKLAYGRKYYVQMDAGVLNVGGTPVGAIGGKTEWAFSIKASAPAADVERITVAADGTGDFATVQGAVDFVPEKNTKPRTIFIRKGVYTEIVRFVEKDHVTFLGEDREQTVVAYANSDNFQPNPATTGGGSYRRGVFIGLNSTDVALGNFTIHNTTKKGGSQAEAIIFKEVRGQTGENRSQTILAHMNLKSFQDTLQITGKAYLEDVYIEGDTDYMWGDGPCYFLHCNLKTLNNGTAFTQTRNPATHHGFVFVECNFDGAAGVTTANLGNGSGASEIALIDCKLGKMLTRQGWNSRGASNLEFHTTNLADGTPYDMSGWPTWVKHLSAEKDAELIAQYRDPAWVLDGWKAALPAAFKQEASATRGGAR
jgi:pectin methylesterase-like acyl-CoA thioesterase